MGPPLPRHRAPRRRRRCVGGWFVLIFDCDAAALFCGYDNNVDNNNNIIAATPVEKPLLHV